MLICIINKHIQIMIYAQSSRLYKYFLSGKKGLIIEPQITFGKNSQEFEERMRTIGPMYFEERVETPRPEMGSIPTNSFPPIWFNQH